MSRGQPRDYGSLSIIDYFQTLHNTAERNWDRFWFQPRTPLVLGFIRICTGLMLLYTHAVWGLHLEPLLGRHSILAEPEMREAYTGAWASFWWYIPADWVGVVHWVCLAVMFLFTIGLWSRVMAVLAWVITVSYANRLFFATFGLDQINAMLTFYLAIGPCGAALSVDRWRRARIDQGDRWCGPPSISANISLRLIQLHMCVIYLFAGLAKLEGQSWWNGYAMWQSFANYEYQTLDLTWLAPHVFVWNLLTHATVAWEISFCTLIWFPLLRPLVLACGILMHLGIGLCLGMWTFGLIMLVGCSSFLSPTLLRRLLRLPAAAN